LAIPDLLQALYAAYRGGESRTRVFGITVQDGAYEIHARPDGAVVGPAKVASRFMDGGVIDLVGAGDAFRAGLLAYIARNLEGFRHGSIDFAEAVQMGNLFAARFIKAPLGNRYAMKPYETMLKALSGPVV
jgi:sugar/nucleoside kinase (ribokinase family)